MSKRISINLNKSGDIQAAIKELERYNKDLTRKCRAVVQRLLEKGIETAKMNCGDYGAVISFSKKVVGSDGVVKGELIAVGAPVARLRGGTTIEMNPLLMAEFGSGFEARVLDPVDGVGTGTFPGQTHAFDATGWWYTDIETGESHHSYGESPTHPMHSAMLSMIFEVNAALEEVFGNG